jgi:hypothetical protein
MKHNLRVVRAALGYPSSLVALLLCLGCSARDERSAKDSIAAAKERRCSDTANAVVSAAGVGPIRLGMSLREVAGVCPVTDTSFAPRTEGMQVAAVNMGRHVILVESGDDSIVTNIILADSAFRTDRGIGVGSRIRTLRFAYGRVCAVDRNGEAVLAVAGLDGLTFSFDPSSLPASVYRTRILGSELSTDAADDLQVREMNIGHFKSPCREQRLASLG